MSDESMERKTLIGFIASVGLLILLSGVAILAVRGYGNSNRWLSHTHEVISELEGLSATLAQTEAARRGYLSTGNASFLEERDAALSRMQSHLQSAKQLTVDNATQQARLRDLERRLAQRAAQVDDLIVLAQTQGLPAQKAASLEEIHQATRAASAKIDELERDENGLLTSRRGADERWASGLIIIFITLLATVTSVLTWLCLRVRTEMRQRSRQAAALNRANSNLESANRELESFSYSVSHDLRSPLRAIDGYSLMLEEDYGQQLDETARRYIHTIRGGSQRMAALIDDLLTFSRLSRQSLNRQTVDMTTLARRAAAEVLESQPGPKPAVNIPELPTVPGDPALLRQVWTNLIGNAVKYSSKSAAPEVQIRAAAEGRQVRYEVQDNGVGFDMKYADKLFGVFQRLHSIEEYPGTGVGLAIVQRIITRHEGAVTAKGERGKGATFGFTLPTEV
ncbi:MAG TPA: CHASE3 domain-containing protein [Steroidobacteraceae bacterium]|nr:CHASE3 domain-containing protein [Steroidobacteraceae bacterium]